MGRELGGGFLFFGFFCDVGAGVKWLARCGRFPARLARTPFWQATVARCTCAARHGVPVLSVFAIVRIVQDLCCCRYHPHCIADEPALLCCDVGRLETRQAACQFLHDCIEFSRCRVRHVSLQCVLLTRSHPQERDCRPGGSWNVGRFIFPGTTPHFCL